MWTEAVKRVRRGFGQFMNGFLLFFPLRLSVVDFHQNPPQSYQNPLHCGGSSVSLVDLRWIRCGVDSGPLLVDLCGVGLPWTRCVQADTSSGSWLKCRITQFHGPCEKEAVPLISWLPLKSQRDRNSECIAGLTVVPHEYLSLLLKLRRRNTL
jgi:hypothetical protein